MTVLRVLLANGWIDLTPSDFPVPVMTPLGWKLMAEDLPIRVRLPARSPAEPPPAQRAPRRDTPAPTTVQDALARGMDRGLYDALCTHRAALARSRSVPAYVIAPNRTLTEIALLRPRCAEDLGLVHGMGPGRLLAYGEGLLSVVRERDRLLILPSGDGPRDTP